ncbi:META domain-containing protein [Formosa sp. S-31]|uniref:META domain-containing protein n=1 Tax=Formosa sp. S-31 TaxID=2790949 RepID=UPI003EBA9194
MRAISFLSVILLSVLILNCEDAKKDSKKAGTEPSENSNTLKQTSEVPTTKDIAFFKGEGYASEWNLELTEQTIIFSLNTEDSKHYNFPLPEPILAADANIKMYRAETESASIRIQVAMGECETEGKSFPYKVSIDIKSSKDTEFTSYKGCGYYITDYRLQDIWVLSSIKGIEISPSDFPKELPKLEINTTDNTFNGFTGCNTMRGSIFSERSKIRFTKIITTRKMCLPENKEPEILKALEATTTFKIENKHLYLSNPDTETLVFKKVD